MKERTKEYESEYEDVRIEEEKIKALNQVKAVVILNSQQLPA